MNTENPFDHKNVEKVLRSVYMPLSPDKRRTRKYLRKMSRHIEHAWEIGRKDGATGNRLVKLEELLEMTGNSTLARAMARRAYVAYETGYRAGCGEV